MCLEWAVIDCRRNRDAWRLKRSSRCHFQISFCWFICSGFVLLRQTRRQLQPKLKYFGAIIALSFLSWNLIARLSCAFTRFKAERSDIFQAVNSATGEMCEEWKRISDKTPIKRKIPENSLAKIDIQPSGARSALHMYHSLTKRNRLLFAVVFLLFDWLRKRKRIFLSFFSLSDTPRLIDTFLSRAALQT